MGEKQNQPFQLSFNAALKVDFQGSRVTSDGGLILVRELDERLGFGDLIAQHLTDSRRGKNTQLPLADFLRQSVYSRIAGYADVKHGDIAVCAKTACLRDCRVDRRKRLSHLGPQGLALLWGRRFRLPTDFFTVRSGSGCAITYDALFSATVWPHLPL